MRKKQVIVIEESDTGLNTKIDVYGKTMTNTQAYNEAKKGNIPGYIGVDNNGTKHIRSVPDGNKNNNLE